MTDEVRPLGCPFCGASTKDIFVANYFHEVKVICSECSAEFTLANHFRNEKQAVVHAWNKRNYHNWTGDIEVIGL